MSNKKGMEAVWWIIITFVILAIVAVVVIFGFRSIYGKEKQIIEGQIENQCSAAGGLCKEDCAEDERFVLGIWKDCAIGQQCCIRRTT